MEEIKIDSHHRRSFYAGLIFGFIIAAGVVISVKSRTIKNAVSVLSFDSNDFGFSYLGYLTTPGVTYASDLRFSRAWNQGSFLAQVNGDSMLQLVSVVSVGSQLMKDNVNGYLGPQNPGPYQYLHQWASRDIDGIFFVSWNGLNAQKHGIFTLLMRSWTDHVFKRVTIDLVVDDFVLDVRSVVVKRGTNYFWVLAGTLSCLDHQAMDVWLIHLEDHSIQFLKRTTWETPGNQMVFGEMETLGLSSFITYAFSTNQVYNEMMMHTVKETGDVIRTAYKTCIQQAQWTKASIMAYSDSVVAMIDESQDIYNIEFYDNRSLTVFDRLSFQTLFPGDRQNRAFGPIALTPDAKYMLALFSLYPQPHIGRQAYDVVLVQRKTAGMFYDRVAGMPWECESVITSMVFDYYEAGVDNGLFLWFYMSAGGIQQYSINFK